MPDSHALLRDALLAALLLIAMAIDCRTRRVPNWLSFGGAALGLALSLLPAQGLPGPAQALAGLALGLAVMLPLRMLRVLGAGDVKLVAMAGAFLGAPQVLAAILFSFIAAGALGLAHALWKRTGLQLLANLRELLALNAAALSTGAPLSLHVARPAARFPFASAVCAGTLALLALAYRS